MNLSKTLKTKVVAEGVETEEQYIMLRDFGVDYIQGFYFGKPIDAISFEKENLSKLKKIS